jgi:2-oxoglutarate dehydrogenase E2 component (dihydrolipoamide succinyltransferase)
MGTDVKVPTIGESITSGILAAWLVKEGATVAQNQPLFSLETDKITTDVASPASGVIHIVVADGTEVAIGQTVGIVAESSTAPADAPAETPTVMELPLAGNAAEAPAPIPAPKAPAPQSGPAARRLAAEKGIDPATLSGTGKSGRVTKTDIAAKAAPVPQVVAENAAEIKTAPAQAPAPVPTAFVPPVVAKPLPTAPKEPALGAFPTAVNSQITDSVSSAPKIATPATVATTVNPQVTDAVTASASARQTRKRMSPLRKRIAERLVRAKSEAAMLTTFNECDMSAVMNLRKVHQEAFQKAHGVKLGFMSFFVKAVVQALKDVPQVNTQIDGDDIIENHFYDIGIAVGAPKGLVVPVVRDADKKSFADIEKSILDYGARARDSKLTIDDLQGGVFTITNGGIYGSLMSTPILNSPQSGILGMHAIKDRAVVVNGQVVARPMMYLALSYDHRVIDGKEAVTFLVKVKEAIEDPVRLLFEV